MREISLLRLRALLARARGDDVAYRDLVRSLSRDGGIAWLRRTHRLGRGNDRGWRLVDRSECKDLAKEHPDKLKALIDVWFEEADKNFVLPLDDRTATEILGTERPQSEPPRTRYVYYPGTAPIPEGVAVNVRGRSYKIIADVDITADATGVIFAHGSRFGGHALFIKDKKLHYVYNFLGIKPEQEFVSEELTPGKHSLGVEFTREARRRVRRIDRNHHALCG